MTSKLMYYILLKVCLKNYYSVNNIVDQPNKYAVGYMVKKWSNNISMVTERKRKHEVNFIFIFMFISSRYQRLKSLPDVFIRGN